MSKITLREILGHESPAVSRHSIQQNFKTIESSWNLLQDTIDTSVPGGAGDLSELILRSGDTQNQNFLTEGSARINGNLRVGNNGAIELLSSGDINIEGSISIDSDIEMTGDVGGNTLILGTNNPVTFSHNGTFIDEQFVSGTSITIVDGDTVSVSNKRVLFLEYAEDNDAIITIDDSTATDGQRIIIMLSELQFTERTVTIDLQTTNVPNPIFGNINDNWVNDCVELVRYNSGWRILSGTYRTS